MRSFLYKLELIVITVIVTAALCSCVALYYFINYIIQDPIYKEALDIVKEREFNNENN